VSLAACLGQLSLSLFLWSTARRGPWDTWQHRSTPLRKGEPRAVGHVAVPKRPSEEGRARSHGTCGRTGDLVKEARSGAEGHVTALELTSTRRRGPGPWDIWQHRSSPRQGGKVRGRETRGSTGAHLGKEARSGAAGHGAAPELISSRRQGPELRDTWQRRSSPQQGGEVRGCGTHGGTGAHLCREVWSEVTAYVAACGCTSCSLS
jgi:hypothetical protein